MAEDSDISVAIVDEFIEIVNKHIPNISCGHLMEIISLFDYLMVSAIENETDDDFETLFNIVCRGVMELHYSADRPFKKDEKVTSENKCPKSPSEE